MTAQEKKEIVQYCKEINEKCQLEYKNFNFEELKSRKWYLNILQILFPHLEQKIKQITKVNGEVMAITRIISEINDLDQFQNLQIDAQKIASGDVNQISNMVQVILALLEIVTEQYEEGQLESQEEVQNYKSNQKKIFQDQQANQKKSKCGSEKPRSVQAIVHEFEKSSQEQQQLMQQNIGKKKNNFVSPSKEPNQTYQNKQKLTEGYKKFPKHEQQTPKQIKGSRSNDKNINRQSKNQKAHLKMGNLMDPQKQKYLFGSKTNKKLVTFPKSPQTIKKARSTEQLALTKKIQQEIKTNKKKKKNDQDILRTKSPMRVEMKRKTVQFNYATRNQQKEMGQRQAAKNRGRNFAQKNVKNLKKILNFKQGLMKKQKQEYEESIKNKLKDQRELYIKKINNLIIELQKEKQRQDKKDHKQAVAKYNQLSINKLRSLEQWYKNKISMLKENRINKNNERMILKSGHKQILNKIQKELKRQNEEKLIQLTNQFRHEHENIQTDFEELKNKIIKVYHKY